MRGLAFCLCVLSSVAAGAQATPAEPLHIEVAHDFTSGPAADAFEVPADNLVHLVQLRFEANWVDPGPRAVGASVGPTTQFTVRDPDGEVAWTHQHVPVCNAYAAGPDPWARFGCGWRFLEFDPPIALAPGTWTVEYSGVGFTTSRVVIDGSYGS